MMFEKLENLLGFTFKIIKWSIMIVFIVFVVILFRSCSETIDVMDDAQKRVSESQVEQSNNSTIYNNEVVVENKCEIEDWKFQKTSSNFITIDGTTTCNRGKLVIKIYDGDTNEYIGNDTTYVSNSIFKTLIRTNANPSKLSIKYTIK